MTSQHCRLVLPASDAVCHVAISASVLLTLAITVERHHAITSPYTYQIRLTNTPRARYSHRNNKI